MKRIVNCIFSLTLLAVTLCATLPAASAEDKIKVACVGDSITAGAKATNAALMSYPAQLQQFLDADKYEVINFGVGGKTAIKETGDEKLPYWNETAYTESKAYNPDIVIIMLGTNDITTANWGDGTRYKTDLKALVESYQALPSKPEIFVATPPHAYDARHPETLQEQAADMVKQVVADTNASLVDIRSKTENMKTYYPDSVHPNDEGYLMLARMFYESVFDTKAVSMTVLTEHGNKVHLGGQTVVADSEGKAVLSTGDGRKTVKIEKPNIGFAYVDITVKGDTTADCKKLAVPENHALSAVIKDIDGEVTKVTDGNLSTGWQRTGDYSKIWLEVDFGKDKSFNSFEIHWEIPTRPKENGYKIEYSNDGSSWAEIPNVKYSLGEAIDTVTCDEVSAKYVKIDILNGTSGKYRPRMFELRIQKTAEEAFVPTVTYASGEVTGGESSGFNPSDYSNTESGETQSAIQGGEKNVNAAIYAVIGVALATVIAVGAVFAVRKKNN